MKEEEEKEWIEKEKINKENLKKITDFLIDFGKGFEMKIWGNGEGWDFIIEEYEQSETEEFGTDKYKQIISISDTGYLKFEKQDSENEE